MSKCKFVYSTGMLHAKLGLSQVEMTTDIYSTGTFNGSFQLDVIDFRSSWILTGKQIPGQLHLANDFLASDFSTPSVFDV